MGFKQRDEASAYRKALRDFLREHLEAPKPSDAGNTEAVPTGDMLRQIARDAENQSGPSDSTRAVDYVLAGWRAARGEAK